MKISFFLDLDWSHFKLDNFSTEFFANSNFQNDQSSNFKNGDFNIDHKKECIVKK